MREFSCSWIWVRLNSIAFISVFLSTAAGTITDSGIFEYKTGQLESALRVSGSLCWMPKGTSELSGSPDPAARAFDRELEQLDSNWGGHEEPNRDMDEALERLALQEKRAQQEELELTRKREEEEWEREDQIRREAEENLREMEKFFQEHNERRERERIAEVQRQAEVQRERGIGEGISTFLQILGTGVTLYNLYNRDSRGQDNSQYGSPPSYSGDETDSYSEYPPCTTAYGQPGFLVQGECVHDDTARPYQ